jgi:hypothetical protein
MTIIGNILLVLASLVVLALNTGSLAKAPPQNDGAVGWGWSIIILNLILIGLIILASLIIGAKGGFEWVSAKKSSRFTLVAIGLLAALFTSALSSFFRYEPGPVPVLIKAYSSFAPLVIPGLMIFAGFIILNSGIRETVPATVYKWPLVLVAVLGITGTASALIGFMGESARNKVAVMKDRENFENENDRRILQDIDSTDIQKNLVMILVFTGDNQPDEIRNKAVAKVKTHPDWQGELIRLLQTDWAPEPLQFLASNEVDDPSLFLEPVRIGVMNQARLIRESISRTSHPSNLYEGQFTWEVERALRTVDRFKGKGVDYITAVKELRDAFNEPSDFEKPKFRCIKMLDDWIRKNS